MTRGRAKLREIGVTPIGLDGEEAAALVGLSVRSFREAVQTGIYPPPMRCSVASVGNHLRRAREEPGRQERKAKR